MVAPLAGVRVIEVASFITGPYAGMLLRDLGATVVKVEHPGAGDPFRRWTTGGVSPIFAAYNCGKQSVCLDLRQPVGAEAMRRLIATADVLIENHRPGVVERLGIDYPTVSATNPRLVYCSITGFGPDGPDAHKPAYDQVGQAVSGLMSLLTTPSAPGPIGPALSDSLTGLFAALGILAALQARGTSGRGQHVRTSMLEATLGFLVGSVAEYLATGQAPDAYTRPRQSQTYAFSGRDDHSLVVHLSTVPKFWDNLLRAVGRTDLMADSRFATYGDRVGRYETIESELAPVFRTRDRREWLQRLSEFDVPCSAVHSVEEALSEPQVEHLGLVEQGTGTDGTPLKRLRPAVWLDDLPSVAAPPALGADTSSVLRSLGYSDDDITLLRQVFAGPDAGSANGVEPSNTASRIREQRTL